MTALVGVNGTVCNAQQYSQFLLSSDSPSPSISCLTHGQTIGLALTAESSLLSFICVLIMFLWIGRNVRWYKARFPNSDWKLFNGPADIYMFSLFVFDLLQAIGGIFDIKWAQNGIVTTGPYCTAQGVVAQIGQLGVALMTLLLAVHTFVAGVFRVGLRARGVAFGLVYLAFVFITFWVAIGTVIHKNYYTPTPYWCWISPQFPGDRLRGEYTWMWIALFASAILYIPLYFWAEGYWSIDEEYKPHWRNADQRVEYAQRRAALGMLLYPVTYSLVVLPITIARWVHFYHHHVPSAVTFFATSIFHLSGVVNVLLFLIIRPKLLLFPRPNELDEQCIQLAPQSNGPANFSDTANIQHSPEPMLAALGDEGSRDSAIPSYVNASETS